MTLSVSESSAYASFTIQLVVIVRSGTMLNQQSQVKMFKMFSSSYSVAMEGTVGQDSYIYHTKFFLYIGLDG